MATQHLLIAKQNGLLLSVVQPSGYSKKEKTWLPEALREKAMIPIEKDLLCVGKELILKKENSYRIMAIASGAS